MSQNNPPRGSTRRRNIFTYAALGALGGSISLSVWRSEFAAKQVLLNQLVPFDLNRYYHGPEDVSKLSSSEILKVMEPVNSDNYIARSDIIAHILKPSKSSIIWKSLAAGKHNYRVIDSSKLTNEQKTGIIATLYGDNSPDYRKLMKLGWGPSHVAILRAVHLKDKGRLTSLTKTYIRSLGDEHVFDFNEQLLVSIHLGSNFHDRLEKFTLMVPSKVPMIANWKPIGIPPKMDVTSIQKKNSVSKLLTKLKAGEIIKEVQVLPHRGITDLSRGLIENSLSSIYETLTKNGYYGEFDVVATKDGGTIVSHDVDLTRLTTFSKRQADHLTENEIVGTPSVMEVISNGKFTGNYTGPYGPIVNLEIMLEYAFSINRDATIFVDCKTDSAPLVVAKLSRTPHWYSRVVVKFQSTDMGNAENFCRKVESRKPHRDWKNNVAIMVTSFPDQIAKSANASGLLKPTDFGSMFDIVKTYHEGFFRAGLRIVCVDAAVQLQFPNYNRRSNRALDPLGKKVDNQSDHYFRAMADSAQLAYLGYLKSMRPHILRGSLYLHPDAWVDEDPYYVPTRSHTLEKRNYPQLRHVQKPGALWPLLLPDGIVNMILTDRAIEEKIFLEFNHNELKRIARKLERQETDMIKIVKSEGNNIKFGAPRVMGNRNATSPTGHRASSSKR